MTRIPARLLLATGLISAAAATAAGEPLDELSAVEVSATRLRSVPDLNVPASVTTVSIDANSNQSQTDITEALGGLAGVTALDRQNYAQDTQLSIRGFGARATFGVRGLRLYADGIPATSPDGQGQLSHFNLMGADHVQVMRGPFSSLYGNSSGGVVQIWSRPGTATHTGRVRATYGSHDSRTFGGQALGTAGLLDYNLSATRFETDGRRPHSAARRDSVNLRLGLDIGAGRSLTFVGNLLDIPEAQDPLGLTPEDWREDPTQTTAVATQFNTRKSVDQLQGGAIFEQRLGMSSTIRASAYVGNRAIVQYLAIPTGPQGSPTHSGGVIDLDNDYQGFDLRWSWVGEIASRPIEFTLGTSLDQQKQWRRGFENFVGTEVGVRGDLRRDETNRVDSFDQYAQAWWQVADRWSVLAGVRHSEVEFKSTDRYVVLPGNQNDSGSQDYGDTTVVGGVMFQPTSSLRVYASMGEGFETPTFNEVSYRADGQPGLAFDLLPATSRNYEIGAKWRADTGLEIDATAFVIDTRNDLVVIGNSGGRSRYGNAPRSRRQGLETAMRMPFGASWQLDATYTLMEAEFRAPYETCLGTPCPAPNVTVPTGADIPGVPRHQGTLRLGWNPGSWAAAIELVASSSLAVRDVPAPLQPHAPGYGIWNAEVGHNWNLASGTLRGFARIENLLDKTYVGSVIVNEGNQRYFESGLDRTAMIGLQWRCD